MIAVLISKLSSMILLALVGLVAVRAGILKQEDSSILSTLIIYVLQPCMIVNAFQIELSREVVSGFVAAVIFSFAVLIFWVFLSMALRRVFSLNRVEEMTLIYSNVGNLVLPLVQMVLGDDMLIYASAMQIPFNLLLWTHCVGVISGENHMDIKKALLNSNVLAGFIGLILMLARVRFPDVIATAVTSLGSMVGPLSMLVIGMIIGKQDLKQVLSFKKGYLIAFLRLIAYPLSIVLILFATGIFRFYPALVPVFQVVFFAIAAPPAAMVSQLALVYDEEPVEAGNLNVIGTILCGVTMPLVLFIYESLF